MSTRSSSAHAYRVLPPLAHGRTVLLTSPASLIFRVDHDLNCRKTASGGSFSAVTTTCTWLVRTFSACSIQSLNVQCSRIAASTVMRWSALSITSSCLISDRDADSEPGRYPIGGAPYAFCSLEMVTR